jgi:beta-lactamase regulating signal transducer with metallopeptidase domain
LIDLLLRECDALRVGRRPKIREVPSLATPAVFGLLRHTICLPVNFVETLTEQELRWVLRHELAHIRRRDTGVMALAAVAQAIHWFNPLVWLTVRKLRAAIEAAADRLALGQPSPAEAASYGQLLLRLAENSAWLRAMRQARKVEDGCARASFA